MSDDFKKIEYDNLYKEILENSNKVYLVLNISIPSTAAFLGYILTLDPTILPSKDFLPFLLLLPFAIILPSIFFVSSSLNSTVRIAAYIKVFYEDEQKDIGWQRRIQYMRNKDIGKRKSVFRMFKSVLKIIFVTLGMICIVLSVCYFISNGSFDFLRVIGYVILLSILLYLLVYLSSQLDRKWSTNYFDDLMKIWEVRKNEEKSLQSAEKPNDSEISQGRD